MIPRAYIVEWRSQAPWKTDAHVEQDLILSRTLLEIFSDDLLRSALAFRGGTALHKLHLAPAARYSEDLDFVQIQPGPIGPILDRLHQRLDPLLGNPMRKQKQGNVVLSYRFPSEIPPIAPLRLKVEINTREHFTVFGLEEHLFAMESQWKTETCKITTYCLDELLGTKLRALYQRRKGRDLFDLWYALTQSSADPTRIIEAFSAYLQKADQIITREDFLKNLDEKIAHVDFFNDIHVLLRPEIAYDAQAAHVTVVDQLLQLLK